mmetsp:Transcript_54933/g.98690  ORF Transcript_54933/g.98690 Transcript_54933/m.98690 type:complete len:209 (+) Transcript_54933:414-1040(+)
MCHRWPGKGVSSAAALSCYGSRMLASTMLQLFMLAMRGLAHVATWSFQMMCFALRSGISCRVPHLGSCRNCSSLLHLMAACTACKAFRNPAAHAARKSHAGWMNTHDIGVCVQIVLQLKVAEKQPFAVAMTSLWGRFCLSITSIWWMISFSVYWMLSTSRPTPLVMSGLSACLVLVPGRAQRPWARVSALPSGWQHHRARGQRAGPNG